MSDAFLGEIRIMACTIAPEGWAACDGQLLYISQNTALYSILGNTYGGNNNTTFALPNLQGRSPMQPGQGSGLSPRSLGEAGGETAVSLTAAHIPAHTHTLTASTLPSNSQDPQNRSLARSFGGSAYNQSANNSVVLASDLLSTAGNSSPHNNMQPYLTLSFFICLTGIYPLHE